MSTLGRVALLLVTANATLFAAPPAAKPIGFESGAMQVRSIQEDGTIEVGDGMVRYRVALRWICWPPAYMPESRRALERLRSHLPEEAAVRLWTPGSKWELDESGRIRALVLLGTTGKDSLQALLVEDGVVTYTTRKDVQPFRETHNRLLALSKEARVSRLGIWSSAPGWAKENSDSQPDDERRDDPFDELIRRHRKQ